MTVGNGSDVVANTHFLSIMSESVQWSKIAIGASMSLCEGLFLGHGMEQMKIVRQATGLSYRESILHAYRQRGVYSVLYRGFFPFGVLQAVTKGLPILFVEGEVRRRLGSHPFGNIIAGVSGGVVQGIFVTPTQRIKTLAMTHSGSSGSIMKIITESIKTQGLSSLFRGTVPMASRRGLDWGLRFAVLRWVRSRLEEMSGTKQQWHALLAALAGGAASGLTLPLDNVIANMQKSESRGGLVSVAKDIFAKRGVMGFFNGFLGRVVHSGYHTMWVGGIGLLVYEHFQQRELHPLPEAKLV